MHKVADTIKQKIDIPLLHIADATAQALVEKKCKKTILLGTRFTMEEDFYKKIIRSYGIEVITPNIQEMKEIDRVIFKELVVGKILEESRRNYIKIIENIYEQDTQIDSVILGCTEIGLLLKKNDINLKIFDTTSLHVKSALELAL